MVSHTNTAVDEALLKIAKQVSKVSPEIIEAGKILAGAWCLDLRPSRSALVKHPDEGGGVPRGEVSLLSEGFGDFP